MDHEPAGRVGQFDLSVDICSPTPESKALWDVRIERLTAWLLSNWEAAHAEEPHADD